MAYHLSTTHPPLALGVLFRRRGLRKSKAFNIISNNRETDLYLSSDSKESTLESVDLISSKAKTNQSRVSAKIEIPKPTQPRVSAKIDIIEISSGSEGNCLDLTCHPRDLTPDLHKPLATCFCKSDLPVNEAQILPVARRPTVRKYMRIKVSINLFLLLKRSQTLQMMFWFLRIERAKGKQSARTPHPFLMI